MKLDRKFLIMLCFLSTLALLPFAGAAQADQVAIGFVSYDDYVQGFTTTFSVFNFTGAQSLTPDFNIETSLNILDATLTLSGPSAGSPISLGTIGPGLLLDPSNSPLPSLVFDSNSIFTMAVLTGTLDVTTVTMADGSVVQLDPNILASISPSGGSALGAGDFGVIYADTAVVGVPEPNSFTLFLAGLFVLMIFRLSMLGKSRTSRDGVPLQFSPK